MIRHEFKCQQLNVITFETFRKYSLERLAISVLPKDRGPGVPTIQRVIQPACFVGSLWSWHSRSVPYLDMRSMSPDPFDRPQGPGASGVGP